MPDPSCRYLHELQRSAVEESEDGSAASQPSHSAADQRSTLEQLLGHQKLHLVCACPWMGVSPMQTAFMDMSSMKAAYLDIASSHYHATGIWCATVS